MNESFQTPENANQRLKTMVVIVSIVAAIVIGIALYLYGQNQELESKLNAVTVQRDSLSKVISVQTRLLEAEGNQFQEDLLKIDSLQNQK